MENDGARAKHRDEGESEPEYTVASRRGVAVFVKEMVMGAPKTVKDEPDRFVVH